MRKVNGSGFRIVLLLSVLQIAVGQLASVCLLEEDGTRLPLATHCARFVVCQRGEVAIIGSCPRGLHFNRELRECDFQWRANCLGLSAFAAEDDQCTCDCCAEECQDAIEEIEETTTTDCDPDTPTSVTSDPSDSTDPTDSPAPSDSTDSTDETTEYDDASNSSNTTPSTPSGVVPSNCKSSRTDCVDKPTGTYVELPGICVSFLQCNDRCAEEFTCPSGLYFNKNTNDCDYWWVVDCTPTADASDEVVGPSGTTCSSQGVCRGQKDGAMLKDPDSNGYFVCQCQCPIAMPCSEELTFNQTAQVCDWKRNASNSDNDGEGAASSRVVCPDGLVYNATADQCDWPVNYVPEVPCNSTSSVCQNQPEGELFAVEGKCNMFYKCNFNCAVEQYCPDNLVYDPDIEECTYPQFYDCPWEYTRPSGPSAGPSGIACEANGRCSGKPEGTYLPSTTDCGSFSVCQCECEVEMECPEGLYWDQEMETCNYETDVACSL
ncbi:chondroitin proteoglycan 2 [Drosophila ficusphila]|uniref:chondroitin proteoglycan 2 n=1 Tax=Drosophila ficusphila TaxID=30025 RepID=UPI0007E7CF77|nr:chondroitin proteoglycan 2 [Drosophila ficusphila]